ESLHDGRPQRLAIPAREGMEEDEGRERVEARQRIAAWQWEPKLAHRRAERFRQFQLAIDGVRPAIDFRHLLVEQPRAFTAVAHSLQLSRPASFSDPRAPQQS